MRIAALTMFVLSALAAAAPARDIFVDNVGGDDYQDGQSPTTALHGHGPCRTITRALQLIREGGRLVLANTGKPYHECVTLQGGRHSGKPDEPFTIVGNGAVLDGSARVPEDAWEHFHEDVFRFRPPRMSHQQLFRDDLPLKRLRIECAGVLPKLEPLEWCLFDRQVYFRVEKDRLPYQYALTHTAHPVGITLYEVRHVTILDLTVQGYQLDGINAHDSAFDVSLIQLIARGNGRSGIAVGGASRVTIEACLIGNNGAAQVHVGPYSRARIVNSNLIEGEIPTVLNQGGKVEIVNDE